MWWKYRLEKIICSSMQRNDLYHIDIQSMLDNYPNVTLNFHNTCVTTYNSKTIINRYFKQNSSLNTSSQPTPPKQLRCHSSFNFLEHCLICGDLCLEKSTKNPGRHKKVVGYRTIYMKDNLIKVCGQMGHSHAEEISSRITGEITDIYATCFQVLFHHEIFQLLSNIHKSRRNLILLTWHSVALLVY